VRSGRGMLQVVQQRHARRAASIHQAWTHRLLPCTWAPTTS